MTRIAIIGAGLAGLTLARELSDQAEVVLFEKSRGMGGRLATRRADPFSFDHGAPYFRARTARFQAQLEQMRQAGVVDIWHARFAEIRGGQIAASRPWDSALPHYVGTPSMNAIGKYLAKGLTIHAEHKLVSARRYGGQWVLDFEGIGTSASGFDLLILAIPAPQARAILPDEFAKLLPRTPRPMTGCFALMLGFDVLPALPFDVALIDDPILSWLSVDSSKPGRSGNGAMVALSQNHWADEHMDDDRDQIKSQMVDALTVIVPGRPLSPDYLAIHRWRYANAGAERRTEVLFDPEHQIGFCGDWCEAGRVEAAFNAGSQLADYILAQKLVSHGN
jgi:predicted NAD/FAD-dependent oxidoreductase